MLRVTSVRRGPRWLRHPARLRRLRGGALVVGALLLAVLGTTACTRATTRQPPETTSTSSGTAYTFGVIGDVPYSKEQLQRLPGWIAEINDAHPAFVIHVGDIKEGGDDCTRDYYEAVRDVFASVDPALIYAPGDNDWADCHLKGAGRKDPLERLDVLRSTMYAVPGRSLGRHPIATISDAAHGYPENVTFTRGSVVIGVYHIVGSENGLEVWEDLGRSSVTLEADRAERERVVAAVRTVDQAFAAARAGSASTVVLASQANLFRDEARTDRLAPLVRTIASAARSFDGDVVLVTGDTHEYVEGDHPLAAGSPWLRRYGVDAPAPGLAHVVVPGDKDAGDGWVEFQVSDGEPTLTWQLRPYS